MSYNSLREWLAALRRIKERSASSQADLVKRQHFEGLPLSLIHRCRDQDVLERAAEEIRKFRPPRGQRGNHFTTKLLIEVNNLIARLRRKHDEFSVK